MLLNTYIKDINYVKNGNQYRFNISSKKLLSFKNEILDIQRNVDNNHVNDIFEFQIDYFQKNNCYFFPSSIIIGIYNNKSYIIDGQHRFEVIKELKNNFDVSVTIVDTNTLEELHQYFKIFNSNKSSIPPTDNHREIKIIEKYFLDNYSPYLKKSSFPKIPHINLNNLLEYISDR